MSTTIAVIPARLDSTRLPRKVLADIGGQPMIVHVWERVRQCSRIDRVLVATDAEEVAEVIRAAGGEVVVTGPADNGTARVAEVAAQFPEARILNVQADQPLIAPEHLELVLEALDRQLPIATLCSPLQDPSPPEIVKCVVDGWGFALYFSRQPIPHRGPWLRHLGVYGFQPGVLVALRQLIPTVVDQSEDLEQLRWMAAGYRIALRTVAQADPGVDTPAQLEAVRRFFER